MLKEYEFTISVTGSAKGKVKAKDKKEAEELIRGGQWDDIDIDIEDVTGIESLKTTTK